MGRSCLGAAFRPSSHGVAVGGGRRRRVQGHSAEVHRLNEDGYMVCVGVWCV